MNWSGSGRRSLDALLVMALSVHVAWMIVSVQLRHRRHPVQIVSVAGLLWLAAPPIVAYALWDTEHSARTWLEHTWFWTLQPLPIDIPGAFTWMPAPLRYSPLQGVTLTMLQVSTIGLMLASLAVLFEQLRKPRS